MSDKPTQKIRDEITQQGERLRDLLQVEPSDGMVRIVLALQESAQVNRLLCDVIDDLHKKIAARMPEPTGVAAMYGAIPAEETDAEFLAQIEAENAKGKPGPAGLTIDAMAKEYLCKQPEQFSFLVLPYPSSSSGERFIFISEHRDKAMDALSAYAASVARRAVAELVKRYEDAVGNAPPLLRHFAAAMKGEA